MYLREIHAEHDVPTLHGFIRENPLGIFTTAIDSTHHPFIQSSHIPWVLDLNDNEDGIDYLGTLRGHIARANPQAKAILDSLNELGSTDGPGKLEKQVMVLFTSSIHHYVTPKFYTETKPDTGKVVPTWNYAAVQLYGEASIYHRTDDEKTSEFLDRQISDLSNVGEKQVMEIMQSASEKDDERWKEPWKVSDAPPRYVELLKKGIIGVEIKIQSIDGKFKMSQEMSKGDREGVVAGFMFMGNEVANKLADVVKQRGELADAKHP
ncbi:transcriptional regulator [Lentinula aff. detonsa]|uniref:Transcriptional regulator n=1 Tax=Lentinula aff. detonsa TaxID=2804958 RepID=A0AA38ND12_9AGAR|nr:transcriptional regulator [Lentinula aff. detonsa]